MAEHGPKAVRDRVAALLMADLGPRITAMLHLWALDSQEIPVPAAEGIVSGEAPDNVLDHKSQSWIEVVTPRLMPRTQTVDLDEFGNLVNRYRYSARIYVWTMAEHWGDAENYRDRLTVAARDALLTYPTLAIPPATGDTGYLVHTNTISEEFGNPYRLKTTRARAAGLLSYEIIEEYATGLPATTDPWGSFDDLDLRVTLLPYTAPVGG